MVAGVRDQHSAGSGQDAESGNQKKHRQPNPGKGFHGCQTFTKHRAAWPLAEQEKVHRPESSVNGMMGLILGPIHQGAETARKNRLEVLGRSGLVNSKTPFAEVLLVKIGDQLVKLAVTSITHVRFGPPDTRS